MQVSEKSVDREYHIRQVKEKKDDEGYSTFYQSIILNLTNLSTKMAVYLTRKKLNSLNLFLTLPHAKRISCLGL